VEIGHLARLSRDECLDLLTTARLGRVGVSIDALPAVLPVVIGRVDDSLVFRTVPGTKLAFAAAGSVVAVEADDFDHDRGLGWSVLVRGRASEVTDPATVERARELLDATWLDEHHAEHYVQVGLDLVTGRRLAR
jgi:nitroimidazol reductase NimA-like FMN-containing flavoprotein (pyridoxamine 5'-phosphate oxidase superfamily)